MGVVACFAAITKEQLDTFLADPDSLRRFKERDRSGINIDKAHNGIACLLRLATSGRTQHTVSQAIFGGSDTAVENLAGGWVRYLPSEVVHEIAAALSGISSEDLAAVYSAEGLIAVEPLDSWLWDNKERALNYLLPHYEVLRTFYQNAACENKAVLQSEV